MPSNISGSNGFITETAGQFNANMAKLNTKLEEALKELTANPSDPGKLAEYQTAMSEYTVYRTAQSNVTKVYKDLAAGIIANFR